MISFQADTAPIQTYDITSGDLRYWVDLIEKAGDLPNEYFCTWETVSRLAGVDEVDEEPPDPIDQSAILSILREDS